jgi:hypothetical protein
VVRFESHRNALALCAALAVLAGCSALGSPSVPRDAQAFGAAASGGRARHAKSDGELLYATIGNNTYVYGYPSMKPVQTLKTGWLGFKGGSDSNNGNMCFDTYGPVYVYAHGGKQPIAKIDPFSNADTFDCAFDPTTHDLAITIMNGEQKPQVVVYSSLSGNPATYADPNMADYYYVGYDDNGNLFVDGIAGSGHWLLDELPKGASSFVELTVDGGPPGYDTLRWDGTYMTVRCLKVIYQFTVSGSTATIVGTTSLKGDSNYSEDTIAGDALLADHPGKYNGSSPHDARLLGLWHYPKGGNAYDVVKIPRPSKKDSLGTVLLSVAPSE